MAAHVQRIDELESIPVAGVNWRPLRRALGITAFGTNAYTADAGEQVIEAHAEGSGHEEMYVVIGGRARLTVAGENIEDGAGTVVYLPDGGDRREAVAVEDGTTVLAVGGMPNTITPSAWEWRFAAAPAYDAGDFGRAYEICVEGLGVHPNDANLHYELACFSARDGNRDRALEHLRKAVASNPRAREWMRSDDDLASIRSALE